MRTKLLFVGMFLLLSSVAVFAQYPEVTIRDIQYQHPDSLLRYGDKKSPYEGDTVVVTGVVMNHVYMGRKPDSTRILNSGAPAFYMQQIDDNGQPVKEYAGIIVRDVSASSDFAKLDTGEVVKITGVVQEYNQTTQLNCVKFLPQDKLGRVTRPAPIELTLDSVLKKGTFDFNVLAEKWEGMKLKFTNLSIMEVFSGSSSVVGTFKVKDANNTQMVIYNSSNYFRGTPAPEVGTSIDYIQGHLETRNTGYMYLINPIYFSDRKLGNIVPASITAVKRDSATVKYGQSVKVTANIADADGSVNSAKLYYTVNNGPWKQVVMTAATGSSTYSATIPAQNDSAYVEYFISALDNQLNPSMDPNDTTKNRYSYFVLNRPLKISDVQYSPRGGNYSPYHGYTLSLTGIVTADTTQLGNSIYIQQGKGPWTGMKLFTTDTVKVGDNVTVTGKIDEYDNLTEMTGISSIVVNSRNNPLPEPVALTTSDIADPVSSGNPNTEKWESVLVKLVNVKVTDVNADGEPGQTSNYGEIMITDATGLPARVELQDGNHKYHNDWDATLAGNPALTRISLNDEFESITGVVAFNHSHYKLIPRVNSDFTGYIASSVEMVKNEKADKYVLSQNYPNPFNPSTTILYSLPKEGNVHLTVFNLLGQEVKTLVNNFQTAGSYKVTFDASELPSGIYFYQLNTGSFKEVKKMILVK